MITLNYTCFNDSTKYHVNFDGISEATSFCRDPKNNIKDWKIYDNEGHLISKSGMEWNSFVLDGSDR